MADPAILLTLRWWTAMYEREVKLRVDCMVAGRVAEAILGEGGRRVTGRREVDVYFQHPCRDLLASDEAVRLRSVEGSPSTITYKGPRRMSPGGVKERLEVTVTVASGDPEALLESMGFTPAVRVVKERVYIDYMGHSVAFDRVEGLGCFVEVEGEEPGRVVEALAEMGLKGEPVEETYAEMVMRLGRGGLTP